MKIECTIFTLVPGAKAMIYLPFNIEGEDGEDYRQYLLRPSPGAAALRAIIWPTAQRIRAVIVRREFCRASSPSKLSKKRLTY